MSDVIKESSIPTKDIHIDHLVPNPNNVNVMTDGEFQRLVEEIKDVGFLDPLSVIPLDGNKFFILGGEHRWKAARAAGLTYVTCCIHNDDRWKDIAQVDLQTFKFNALKGHIDGPKFQEMYKRLCETIGPDKLQAALAVTDNSEWRKLTKDVISTLRDQGAPDSVIDKVKDAQTKTKNPADLTKRLSKILRDYQSLSTTSNVLMFQHKDGEHTLIQADEEVFTQVRRIVAYCEENKSDINKVLLVPLTACADRLEGKS
jgi:hypothetical protein